MTRTSDSFEQLYRAHAANAFLRARRLLGQDADAHEVVHDVFLSLCERPEQHAGRSSMSTFLYSAVTHACLNRIRDRKNRERLLEAHGFILAPTATPLAADQMVQLRSMLARIPEPLGHVAVYHYMDGLAQHEIASVMGCSRRHIGDLLLRLASWLQAQAEAECG